MNILIIIISVFVSGALWFRYLYRYDRLEPEPIWKVVAVGLAGGFLSATVAGFVNVMNASIFGIADSMQGNFDHAFVYSMLVGLNEEFCKAIATVLLVIKLKDLNEPIDAVIYSTAVGLGFAVIENLEYTYGNGLTVLVLRSFTSIPLHVGTAAIWGYYIATSKFLNRGNMIVEMFPAILLAAIIHAFYDFVIFYSIHPLINILSSLIIAFIIIRLMRNSMIYLETQSPFLESGKCFHCNTSNPIDAMSCSYCGKSLELEFYAICKNCGLKNPKDIPKCKSCETDLINQLS